MQKKLVNNIFNNVDNAKELSPFGVIVLKGSFRKSTNNVSTDVIKTLINLNLNSSYSIIIIDHLYH